MEQRRLLRDSLFNLSASVLTAVLGLIAIPLFVSKISTAEYADWIVVLATSKSAVIIDFGIGWTIVRLIALEGRRLTVDARQHMRAAATFVTGLAAVGGIATFVAGWIQLQGLEDYRLTILTCGAVMATMSQVNNYSMSILWGRRRFDLAGLLLTIEAAIQSGGVIAILLAGGDITDAALWEAATVTATALIKLIVAAIVCPDAAFRPAFRWPTAPLQLVRFGLASQVSDGLSSLFWSLGVLILAQVATPASVVAFSVAQKIPLALAGFVTRAAEVTMPAASGLADGDRESPATVAVSSARIAVALCIPAVVTIWFVAAPFMMLWVGGDIAALVPAMRISAVAVAAHSLGESARYFLWGTGRVGAIVLVQLAGTATLLVGGGALYLLSDIHAASFAALQAVAVGVMSVALSVLTAERAGLSRRTYAVRVARGIPLAAVAAIAAGVGLTALWPTIASWLALITVAAGITVTFAALMIGFGLDAEEAVAIRRLVRQT
ncbi:MAG: lipopolysaccharide biosynthesis protein [Alphaproteobacteria bacterium]|nr:lipopolysaccharide biosynthesis protein [Alphaproteobacteria bacterium]